jgi:hypothetical protein
MKKLLKRATDEKKKKKPHPLLLKYREDKMNNSPILARVLWRCILFHRMGATKILYHINKRYSAEKIDKYAMECNLFYKDARTLRVWLDRLQEKLREVDKLYAEKSLDVYALDPLADYFERFNRSILPLLDGEIFDWLRCASMEESVLPKIDREADELYSLACAEWPEVDF